MTTPRSPYSPLRYRRDQQRELALQEPPRITSRSPFATPHQDRLCSAICGSAPPVSAPSKGSFLHATLGVGVGCDLTIESNADNPITLADLAREAGLSRMHFAAQFRKATGLRPHQYLLQRRVEKAKTLLATSSAPIAEVALSVGFSSQSHFTGVFKRLTNHTPLRWRELSLA